MATRDSLHEAIVDTGHLATLLISSENVSMAELALRILTKQRDAAEYYQKAIALDSSNVVAINNLAYVLSRDSARVDEALTFARKAKELAPESPQIMDTLGWLYYRKGLYQQASRELEAALAKAEWPSIQFHLGLTYNRLGKTVKGSQLVAAALAKAPQLAAETNWRDCTQYKL